VRLQPLGPRRIRTRRVLSGLRSEEGRLRNRVRSVLQEEGSDNRSKGQQALLERPHSKTQGLDLVGSERVQIKAADLDRAHNLNSSNNHNSLVVDSVDLDKVQVGSDRVLQTRERALLEDLGRKQGRLEVGYWVNRINSNSHNSSNKVDLADLEGSVLRLNSRNSNLLLADLCSEEGLPWAEAHSEAIGNNNSNNNKLLNRIPLPRTVLIIKTSIPNHSNNTVIGPPSERSKPLRRPRKIHHRAEINLRRSKDQIPANRRIRPINPRRRSRSPKTIRYNLSYPFRRHHHPQQRSQSQGSPKPFAIVLIIVRLTLQSNATDHPITRSINPPERVLAIVFSFYAWRGRGFVDRVFLDKDD